MFFGFSACVGNLMLKERDAFELMTLLLAYKFILLQVEINN